MINRIFISTNTGHWDSLFRPIPEADWKTKLDTFKHNKVLNNTTSIELFPNVIFISDGLPQLPIDTKIDREVDVLLHHTTINDIVKSNFKLLASSQHSTSEDSKYRQIFKILLDDVYPDKQKNIISLFDYLDTEKIERLKTDFLYHIYNGNTPSSFTKLAEIKDVETYKGLYQAFESNVYKKQLDLDADETTGAEQRKELSLLRDALLNQNK